jgi:hypothetical protein
MIKGFAWITIIRILKIPDNPVIPLISIQTTSGGTLTFKNLQPDKISAQCVQA